MKRLKAFKVESPHHTIVCRAIFRGDPCIEGYLNLHNYTIDFMGILLEAVSLEEMYCRSILCLLKRQHFAQLTKLHEEHVDIVLSFLYVFVNWNTFSVLFYFIYINLLIFNFIGSDA